VRLLAPVVLIAIAVAVIGIRLAGSSSGAPRPAAAKLRFVPIPSNPPIEAAWGIRFTGVLLEADRGMIDVRYQVVDPARSGRIHGGKSGVDPNAQLANLPTLVVETSGKKIAPSSAMMHFEHFHFQTEVTGSTYSVLYGNSGGLLHLGEVITIHMADGLDLPHVVVAN
jgi:hypothetical protein